MQAAHASQEQLFLSLRDAVDAYIECKEATAFELVFSDQLEEGAYRLLLGVSSRDVRLTKEIFYQTDMLCTMPPMGVAILG